MPPWRVLAHPWRVLAHPWQVPAPAWQVAWQVLCSKRHGKRQWFRPMAGAFCCHGRCPSICPRMCTRQLLSVCSSFCPSARGSVLYFHSRVARIATQMHVYKPDTSTRRTNQTHQLHARPQKMRLSGRPLFAHVSACPSFRFPRGIGCGLVPCTGCVGLMLLLSSVLMLLLSSVLSSYIPKSPSNNH